MGIVVVVGMEVMLTMVGDPGAGASLQGHRASGHERILEPARHAKAAVREKTVITHRDAETRDHVEQQHYREVAPAEDGERSDRADMNGDKVESQKR